MTNQIYKVCAPGYVAAIIQGTYQLALWLTSVPRSRLDTLRVESMTGAESYPFDLLECKYEGKAMFLHSKLDETDALKKTMKGLGATILATYRIKADFMGSPHYPGADHMGVLDHVHEEDL